MEYTFIKNSEGKLLTFTGGAWIDSMLSEPLTKQNFIDYGISSINSITQSQWDLLNEDEVEFVVWSNKSTNFNLVLNSQNTYKPIFVFNNSKLLCFSTTNPKVTMNIKAQMKSRFLFSKDGRNSWWTFNSGAWQQVLLSDISTKGMKRTEVNALSDSDINTWFKRGTLDYAVYLYSESNVLSPVVNNLIATYPANSAPTISNFAISPDTTLYRTNIQLTADLQDLEGDLFQYKITINGYTLDFEGNNGWSDWLDGEQIQHISHTYNYLDFKVGNNEIIIYVKDDRGVMYTSPTKTLNMINNNPILTSIVQGQWGVSGSLDDINGDKVRYRMLINGVQKYPYTEDFSTPSFTEYFSVPHYIEHSWISDDLILNQQNTIKFEIEDYVGGKLEFSYQVVGKYKNLMFKDSQNNYYTTDHGQLLSYLDFGILTAGQTSDSIPVTLVNSNGFPIENTIISVNTSTVSGFNLDIAKDTSFLPSGSDTLTQLIYPSIMQDGDEETFFVRIRSDVHSSGTSSVWEIDATTSPI